MNSKTIKAVVLAYYRYHRNYFVSTETDVTGGIADVLAVSKDGSISVEVEVKTSLADLKNEWTTKALKHMKLQESTNRAGKANYYFIAVPQRIVDKVLEDIDLHGDPRYGVMSVSEEFQLTIVRQGKRLNKANNEKLTHRIFLRATSELVNDYVKRHTTRKRLY